MVGTVDIFHVLAIVKPFEVGTSVSNAAVVNVGSMEFTSSPDEVQGGMDIMDDSTGLEARTRDKVKVMTGILPSGSPPESDAATSAVVARAAGASRTTSPSIARGVWIAHLSKGDAAI